MLRVRRRAFFLASLGVLISLCFASPVFPTGSRVPPSFGEPVQPLSSVYQLTLPRLDHSRLLDEDLLRESAGLPLRYAIPLPLAWTPLELGTWESLQDRQSLWRLRVRSPGAHSLNFGFGRYHMPAGGELYIYTPDRSRLIGPFTDGDNEVHGQLWTPLLPGDEAVIELKIPDEMMPFLELELSSINHGYREILIPSQVKSGDCNIDVICPEADEWADEIRSVALISIGGGIICSGFLVNNTAEDMKPYFITADHCGVNIGNAPSLVVYWNFVRSECEGTTGGDWLHFQTGSIFRAGWDQSEGTDFTLVELDDSPDQNFFVHWAGWDRSDADPPSAVTIHHPRGDEKSISFEDDPLTTTSRFETEVPGDGHYLRVEDWDLGTTESGSSGAGLWNPDRRIVGQLTGGFAACDNDLSDWYGRFSVAWEGGGTSNTRLKDWLDPANTGNTALDGRDACIPPSVDFTISPNPANAGEPVLFTSIVTGGVPPYTFAWDMDADGRTDCETPECTFTYKNSYNGNVWLTVTDSQPCAIPVTHAVAVNPPVEMTVLDPNGGEIIPSGSTYTIQWARPSGTAIFGVYYSPNKGRTWRVIAKDIPGTSHTWQVPIERRNMRRSLVKVIGYDERGKRVGSDKSDGSFTVEVVGLTSPDGGERLVSGSVHRITWSTHGTMNEVAKVKLFYSKNNGTTWKRIVTLDGNAGLFDWIVPQVDGVKPRCKVKLTLLDTNGRVAGGDQSKWPFVIEPAFGF